MRLRSCLHSAGTGGFLAAVAWLLSTGTWAACPDTQKYECLCLQPATTVDCTTIGDKTTCNSQQGQEKMTNYWDCKSGSGTECLNASQEHICYIQSDCYWDLAKKKCVTDDETAMPFFAVLKTNVDCPPES